MQSGGYAVYIDIRDPGQYYLQLGISWFFGATDPREQPVPVCVGEHMANYFSEANLVRSLVHGGEDILVELSEDDVPDGDELPRFGTRKCSSGDEAGRWLNLGPPLENPCMPPFCTGDRVESLHHDNVQCRDMSLLCFLCVGLSVRRLLAVAARRMGCTSHCGCGCPTRATTICTPKRTCFAALPRRTFRGFMRWATPKSASLCRCSNSSTDLAQPSPSTLP